MTLSDIQIDPKLKGSINYAKARAMIDMIAKSRKDRRDCRNVVISHLHGSFEYKEVPTRRGVEVHTFVTFPDGSIARY